MILDRKPSGIYSSSGIDPNIQQPRTIGEEDDDQFDEDDPMVDVTYYEIDSSRMSSL